MRPTKFLPVLLLGLAACRATLPVHFSSNPPGAAVIVDGQDTGFVTPCLMELADVPTRQVQFQLPGFRTEARTLRYAKRTELVFWSEASGPLKAWNFPLWLGSQDFFLPRKNLSGEAPARVYVRLRREADL